MTARRWCAAIFAAFLIPGGAWAQDVTLTAREGGLTLSGTLQGYDGEFYRILTSYGVLTIDGEGVICDGPGCPDLTAPPFATIRVTGASDAGRALLPPLVLAFARQRGLVQLPGEGSEYGMLLLEPATGNPLAEFTFSPSSPADARAALLDGRAELAVAVKADPELAERPMALDALIPVVARDNPTPRISSRDLVRVLAGEVENWSEVGGPDMPLVLHALPPASDVQQALALRLGRDAAADILHPDLASLAAAVAQDPYAVAVTGAAVRGPAKPLQLTDSCGFPLDPSRLAVKAQDYPLALPIYFISPRRRLPLMAREFLDFLATPAAQTAVAEAGYIDRSLERRALTLDGQRLVNAIAGAGEDVTLDDLKRLAKTMAGAERLSMTFRFEDGSSDLDAHSVANVGDLADMLSAGLFDAETLVLAGFSDGTGGAAANLDLARERAEQVLAAVAALVPDLAPEQLPQIAAFGEALPMACDTTGPGQRINRRVELWVTPGVTDSPAP
jgi:phosphate transport system substrate-binding protein